LYYIVSMYNYYKLNFFQVLIESLTKTELGLIRA